MKRLKPTIGFTVDRQKKLDASDLERIRGLLGRDIEADGWRERLLAGNLTFLSRHMRTTLSGFRRLFVAHALRDPRNECYGIEEGNDGCRIGKGTIKVCIGGRKMYELPRDRQRLVERVDDVRRSRLVTGHDPAGAGDAADSIEVAEERLLEDLSRLVFESHPAYVLPRLAADAGGACQFLEPLAAPVRSGERWRAAAPMTTCVIGAWSTVWEDGEHACTVSLVLPWQVCAEVRVGPRRPSNMPLDVTFDVSGPHDVASFLDERAFGRELVAAKDRERKALAYFSESLAEGLMDLGRGGWPVMDHVSGVRIIAPAWGCGLATSSAAAVAMTRALAQAVRDLELRMDLDGSSLERLALVIHDCMFERKGAGNRDPAALHRLVARHRPERGSSLRLPHLLIRARLQGAEFPDDLRYFLVETRDDPQVRELRLGNVYEHLSTTWGADAPRFFGRAMGYTVRLALAAPRDLRRQTVLHAMQADLALSTQLLLTSEDNLVVGERVSALFRRQGRAAGAVTLSSGGPGGAMLLVLAPDAPNVDLDAPAKDVEAQLSERLGYPVHAIPKPCESIVMSPSLPDG